MLFHRIQLGVIHGNVDLIVGNIMKKRWSSPLLGWFMLLMSVSCATSEQVVSELDGEWELVSVAMDTTIYDLNGISTDIDPYLGFDLSRERFYGNAAYNTLTGDVFTDSLDMGRLGFFHVATTRTSGPTLSLEQSIVANLEKVQRYETFGLTADSLQFYDENGKMLFTLARRAPYSQLMGRWQITNVKGKDVGSEVNAPYIAFDINRVSKVIYGNTGCNTFNGSLRLELGNQKIHFDNLAVSGSVYQQVTWEGDLLSAFNEVDTYTFEGKDEVRIFDAQGDEILRLERKK